MVVEREDGHLELEKARFIRFGSEIYFLFFLFCIHQGKNEYMSKVKIYIFLLW